MFAILMVAFAALPLTPVALGKPAQTVAQPKQDPEQLIQAYFSQLYALKFADALATANRLEVDPSNADGRAFREAMRGAALLGLKRDQEAMTLFAEADRLSPTSADISSFQFESGMLTEHHSIAASAIDRLIARFPDVARGIDWDQMRWFLHDDKKAKSIQSEDRLIALARLGYGGDTETGDYLVSEAIKILVKRGDVAGAGELLSYLDAPTDIEDLLIQRRYAVLWPKIEQMAGPHLRLVRASSAANAERNFAAAPQDHDKLQLYANALRKSGRLNDAIALRSKLPATREAMASADEEMGWAVNNVALALHEAGRAAEADALLALLNEVPMAKEYWRVSMKINRLEMLVGDGKYEKALPLIEPTASTEGSPYAQQLVRRLRFCTLNGLGRKAEAAKYLPDLLKHAEDAPGPTIDGLICADEDDKAEQLALASLKDDGFQEDFVRQLQSHKLTSDDPSVWQEKWQKFRARPAIAREFDRLGRDLPEAFLPEKNISQRH